MHKNLAGEIFFLFKVEKLKSLIRFIFLLIWFISTYSCQSMIRKEICVDNPDSVAEADKILSTIKSRGKIATTIKGIGKISLWNSDSIQTVRAAWFGSRDGRVRIEMLGLPGQPIAKFIYDGKNYYFVSPLNQELYRKSAADANLKPLTGISVVWGDIMLYLSGLIPLKAYDQAIFQNGGTGCSNILVLKRKWHGVVEKIYLDDARENVTSIEMYGWGGLVYRVEIGHLQKIDGHEIPFFLSFSDGNKKGFSIEVERSWQDAPINPETFQMESPGVDE